ncbi:hypothetical protein [Streptomyces sp. SID13031]|uniref:hypothetical protein n=1 Tax=Streptomyces sp. SID13031 TaxID=2706046 RepID=UPI0013C57A61|nr:hypothetical protein [Streptomyces sp. SID13031]NEA31273.1 hypothetical protein [Streptomyces sp. SID13031]
MSMRFSASAGRRSRRSTGRFTLRTLMAVCLAFGVLLSGSTTAAFAAEPITEALERVADGTYTAADLDLLRSYPEIAAQVPDPTAKVEMGSDTNDNRTIQAICGAWVDVWYRHRSLTGSTIYQYHQRVVYCRDGTRVTSWQSRYDYLSYQQSIVNWKEQTVNQEWGIGTSSAWSHIQRHIELCIPTKCYAHVYPWIKIGVRGNGTYEYTGSAS